MERREEGVSPSSNIGWETSVLYLENPIALLDLE